MPKSYLRQPGFTWSACGPFTKNKERPQKFKETDSKYIYKNELDKACFQLDMAYGDFKDLLGGVTTDEILCNNSFDVRKFLKCDETWWISIRTCFNGL